MTRPTDPTDVVVIGGGLVGMALSYELVARGLDVVLVDRHHEGRATDAGAGILSPETFMDPDDKWAALARSAGEHHRQLTARVAEDGVGGNGTGHSTCGLIRISTSEGEDEWFAKAAEIAQRRNPATVSEIDPAEAVRHFPPLAPVRSALYNSVAARIDGRLATKALAKAAATRGLRTVHGEVTSLELDGDRSTAVHSSGGRIPTGAVAIAGGAWTPRFAAELRNELPIAPMKGQIIHMALPDTDTTSWPIVQPIFSHYLVPWPDGRVACGGTLEADAGFDTRPTVRGVHELLREALRTAPGMASATVTEVRVGLRPASSDDRPVVGRLPSWSNVFVATGHGTEGLLMGPYTSALLAYAIVSGRTPDEITDLSPARFALSS